MKKIKIFSILSIITIITNIIFPIISSEVYAGVTDVTEDSGVKVNTTVIDHYDDIDITNDIVLEKDIEDLNQIMPKCDKELLNRIINEILGRDDLFESKRNEFIKKLKIFREKYNV